MQLHTPNINDFSNVDSVGVALSQYAGEQNHIGILFQFDDVMLLHVGDHKSPLLDKPTDKFVWLDLGRTFHPIRKQVILASIQHIAEKNKDSKIRYGLDHGIYCLDAETGLLNENYDQSIGFTCATFVIEVFLSVGIKLIDWDTWPSGEEKHTEFQKMVFNYLERNKRDNPGSVTEEYLKAQAKNIGKARFLPQEVAAATQNAVESTKDEVNPIALKIHEELTAYTKEYYKNR